MRAITFADIATLMLLPRAIMARCKRRRVAFFDAALPLPL